MPTKARDQGWKELDKNLITITSLQEGWMSCAQIHSDASSIKNSRCKGGSGERMGTSGENPGMAADESEELLDLDMEPKPESLWWTSAHQHGDVRTLSVGGRDKVWDLPFCEIFDVLGYRVCRDGKGFQGAECSMCKALRSWWRDKYIYRSKTVPMSTKRKRVHSHAYSTVLNGSRRVREKPRYCVSPSDLVWVTYRIRTSRSMRTSWKKKGPAAVDREICV